MFRRWRRACPRRGAPLRPAPDHRLRDAADVARCRRRTGRPGACVGRGRPRPCPPAAACAEPPRLRQPLALDHAGAPPGGEGRLPRPPAGRRGQGPGRADAGRPARLPGAAAAGRRRTLRAGLRPRHVAQDVVRRSRCDRRLAAAPRRRRRALRHRRPRLAAHRPADRRHRRRADAPPLAQAAAGRAHRHPPAPRRRAVRLRARAQCRGPPARRVPGIASRCYPPDLAGDRRWRIAGQLQPSRSPNCATNTRRRSCPPATRPRQLAARTSPTSRRAPAPLSAREVPRRACRPRCARHRSSTSWR